jgi:hypothetical protein
MAAGALYRQRRGEGCGARTETRTPVLTTYREIRSGFPLISEAEPWHFGMDPDPRIDASDYWIRIQIESCYCRHWPCQQKTNLKKKNSAYYFLKGHLHHFSKIKSQKKSQNSNGRNQLFLLDDRMIRSVPVTNWSGSRRPKNIRGVRRIGSATLLYASAAVQQWDFSSQLGLVLWMFTKNDTLTCFSTLLIWTGSLVFAFHITSPTM